MYAIAGYLLILIYILAALIAIAFLLTIVVAIVASINGIIADRKYYENGGK